jgi:hypothetical protein
VKGPAIRSGFLFFAGRDLAAGPVAAWSEAQCGVINSPGFAEPVIGRRFAPIRWIHPG